MLDREYATQTCSIARALEVVGERWTLLILRSIGMGATKFDQLQEQLGITRSVLTTRLNRLIDEGLLEKERYQERPPRYRYLLTEKGGDLWPVLVELLLWGDRHYMDPDGPPTILEHKNCGGQPDHHLICRKCGQPFERGNFETLPGPARQKAGATP